MKVPVTNSKGKPFQFQHAGIFHVLPVGVSLWEFEIAERLERKFGCPMAGAVPEAESDPVGVVEPDPIGDVVVEPEAVPTPEPPVVETKAEAEPPSTVSEPSPEHPEKAEEDKPNE